MTFLATSIAYITGGRFVFRSIGVLSTFINNTGLSVKCKYNS